jgi:tetratricopeptide (TPR) repeat protein
VRAFWCAFDRIIISGEAGDLDNLTRYVEVADATAAAISQPGLLRFATYGRSWVTLLAGRLQEAERLAERALAIATEVGDPDGLLVYGVQLGCIRWHQGRVPEILDAFEQVASEQDGTLSLLPAIALLSAESDRLDRARELLAMGRAGGFAHPFDSLLLNDLCCWAEAATFTEDVESAAMIYEQLAPWHHLVVSTGANTLGAVSQFLGQLARVMGRQESARAHLFEALELHQGLGAPFHVARTRLEWGRSLSADGTPASREAAREQLTEALRVARRHGCAAVERRAMEALARL